MRALVVGLVAVVVGSPGLSAQEFRIAVTEVAIKSTSIVGLGDTVQMLQLGDTVLVSGCTYGWCHTRLPEGWVVIDALMEPGEDLALAAAAYERAGFDRWESLDWSLWERFKHDMNRLDKCALRIVHSGGEGFDPQTDWPSYCNAFKDTPRVLARIAEVRGMVAALDVTTARLRDIREGRIWIGAPRDAAEASWGAPQDINRTTTAAGVTEQWVYGDGNYLYLTDGIVTSIQN